MINSGACFAVLFMLSGVCGLRLVSYHIPSVVDFREEVALTCEFDGEGEPIHTVSWSVNGSLFYSYTPNGKLVKHINGISVREDKSDIYTVVLSPVYFSTSGLYRCEATTQSSTPNSLAIHKTLHVIGYPTSAATIEGIHASHTWGDLLELNCSSAPSYPPAHIIWTVADVPVEENQLIHYEDEFESEQTLRVTKTGVKLQTDELPFGEDGELSVNCIAVVPGLYRNFVTLRLAKAQAVPAYRSGAGSRRTGVMLLRKW